jgi:hypothetical protein
MILIDLSPDEIISKIFTEIRNLGQAPVLMPVILATQETEIRKITVQTAWANSS